MYRYKKKAFFICSMILLVWTGTFAFANGNAQSFWADEMSSIGFIRSGMSVGDMFEDYLKAENNLPLYSFLLYFIYRIVPYGEQFVLLPSIIGSVLGVLFLGLTARKLKGNTFGIIVVALGSASNSLLWQAAWEARCYGLVFFFSAVSLYFFVLKSLQDETMYRVLFAIVCFFFMWTHWFASLVVVVYGVADLLMILSKRICWKNIFCYILGGCTLLLWMIAVFMNRNFTESDFWAVSPDWKNTVWTVLSLLSGRRLLWYICLLTCGFIGVHFIPKLSRKKRKTDKLAPEEMSLFICVCTIAFVIGCVFVYSKFINPQGSMYVERYFTVILPHVLVITAYGIITLRDYFLLWVGKIAGKGSVYHVTGYIVNGLVALLLIIELGLAYRDGYIAIHKPFEDFRSAADYLIEDEKIWNEKALLTGSNKYCVMDGFVDFYFVKRGYKEPENIINGGRDVEQENRFYQNYRESGFEELLSYDTIYVLCIHMYVDDEFEEFLMENYEKVENSDDTGIEVWKIR